MIALLAFSCTKDKAPAIDPNCTETISFSQEIQPMISQNCSTSGCHDASTQASGYNFTTHAGVAAHASVILNAIRHEGGATPMPQGAPKLADSLIQQFSCWAGQGALNN